VSGGGAALPATVAVNQNWEFGATRPEAQAQPTIVSMNLDGVLKNPTAGTTEAAVILASTRATKYDV
jgi:hypothetical protein